MEAYALYQHQNLNKRGLSLKRMHDEGIFPVIDEYLRIRQVIPEDTNASVEQIVKTEVENELQDRMLVRKVPRRFQRAGGALLSGKGSPGIPLQR